MPEERGQPSRDRAIAEVAARQHGVITSPQLVAAGMSTSAIGDRVRAGRLYRVHRGVYAVGQPRISDRGRYLAAVLASGEGAVLSHRSAAELWGILRPVRPSAAGPGPVHVTVPRAGRRRRSAIALHRSSTLRLSECTRRDGIPVTTPVRTLDDLRRVLSPEVLAAAVRQAEFLDLPVRAEQRSDRPHSELEARLLALCRRHRLRPPEVNVQVDRFLVDFLWRRERVIVEVDGWASHRTRSAFEADRARDIRLKLLGYEVVRLTWRRIRDDGAGVAGAIRTILSAHSLQQRLGA